MTGDTAGADEELALVLGPPLDEEPGLGALTLPGFLSEVTTRHAGDEALVMHHPDGCVERWCYADLWARAVEVARALVACGVGKGTPVGILMTNRPEWVSACFGISLAGGTVVGLSTFSTPDELAYLLKASGTAVLLFERHVIAKDFAAILEGLEPALATAQPGTLISHEFPFLRHVVEVDPEAPAPRGSGAIESWNRFLSRGAAIPAEIIEDRAKTAKPSDPALLFFSSGSTGRPKGILNSHRGVCIQGWRNTRIYAFDVPVRTWSANGLFWSGNFALAIGGTFAGGGTLVLQPTFVPSEAIRLMEAERVSLPYCWPHQWAQLEAEPAWEQADLSSFHYCDVERNLRRPQKSITTTWLDPRASYGATETFTISTSYPVDTPRNLWEGNNGPPLPGNTIKIVDPDTGRTLKRGETGEFAVKGPTLMLGYIGVPNDEALDTDGFYRSGDGGFIDEAGRFVFQGRINDIIKTGGANVSPVEVDWELGSYPGVKICKTTGIPHETLGEMVVSLIVPEDGHMLDEAAIIAWLKTRLASYKVPRRIVLASAADLGLTGSAKIKPADARTAALALLSPPSAAG